MPHRSRLIHVAAALLVLPLVLQISGCDSPSGPDDQYPDPGPGPHFSVLPIDMEKLARVTPVGTNGKILPTGHTYWYTCDTEYLMPVDRPCTRERLPIRSPVDGRVFLVEHDPDGWITIEGPPGLHASFAHVTPTAGLERGVAVRAGDTIAVMYTDFAFDFGVTNYGREEHRFINQARFADLPAYLHTESPIAQFPEPFRSQLIERVSTQSDPLGRISFDVAGTASGGWFLESVPMELVFTLPYIHAQLFLGPLQERDDVRIVSHENGWFPSLLDLGIVDMADPRWEDIRESSGPTWLRLWQIARDGGPDIQEPRGGLLVQVLPAERLRVEWFDTHEEVAAFTEAASLYVR